MQDFIDNFDTYLQGALNTVRAWVTSPEFYAQLGAIALAIVLAWMFSGVLKRTITVFKQEPAAGRLFRFRSGLFRSQKLLFPLLALFFLGVGVSVAEAYIGQTWLIRIARGIAVVMLAFTFISNFIANSFIRTLTKWVGIPIAVLQVFGFLSPTIEYLDSVALNIGDIHVSLYALLRTVVFGTVLFWLGSASNSAGKQAIRSQQALDAGSREVFAKLFEIALFVIVFLLLLQVMGINLTALAVFGGALGVGLGFGLQQIASNFISGIIILLDRSVTIGDFIELEDGRSGRLRDLNMRYGVIETYDGKDVMVPNEAFITSSYTNWTHKDPRQRYPITFQVAYSTDLDLLFDNVREICNAHPMVLSGDELPLEFQPDAEIAGFGDSGIDILVEFWMEGIDDGPNRVGADLMHSIWRSIQEHGMEIPFPQREVRIIGNQTTPLSQ
ncbi:MAG: mechanosensitive ion channel family protein [Pseudomonadales bacterium]